MTDIVDIDSYILIKPRQRLISPYVVKAIGNQTYLEGAISGNGGEGVTRFAHRKNRPARRQNG